MKYMLRTIKEEKGQTLIETLAALAIISLVVTAIAIAVTSALNNAKFNENQTLATKYAQQGSEIVQQIRDENYANFKTYSGNYCLGKGKSTLGAVGNCSSPNVDNFVRSVTIAQNSCGANVAQVTVTVAFTDGKCSVGSYCHKQTDLTCLSTVGSVQLP
jgi:type II secretory pathway pseudopilin PulG